MNKTKQPDRILAADIGGTNSAFALVDISSTPTIVHKARYPTSAVSNFPTLVNGYLTQLRKEGIPPPEKGCFAIAGPVSNNKGRLTHAKFEVDAKELLEKTALKEALVINDFDAISFAIATLPEKDKILIKKGERDPHGRIAVIGAGTGLGKSLLVWDEHYKAHVPVPSETGHADLAVHSQEEYDFTNFTLKRLNLAGPASWEMALSGQGLVNIHEYIASRSGKNDNRRTPPETKITPELISANRKSDRLCAETFSWFERFYARCAKNAVLDYVATGGVYIAGGIVANNKDLFGPGFIEEFTKNLRLRDILVKTPIWGITNYDVSLTGCANALRVWNDRTANKDNPHNP